MTKKIPANISRVVSPFDEECRARALLIIRESKKTKKGKLKGKARRLSNALSRADRLYCKDHGIRIGTIRSPKKCPRCGADGVTIEFVNGRKNKRQVRRDKELLLGIAQTKRTEKNRTDAWWSHYNSYITSPAWRRKRSERILIDGGRCVDCDSSSRLHVHHLHYRNLGNELMDDLVTVCHPCHEIRHGREFGSSAKRRA